VTEDELQHAEKVGIQGRLIENTLAQPIARGDALCPLIIRPAVAGEMIKERDRLDLPKVINRRKNAAAKTDPNPNSDVEDRDLLRSAPACACRVCRRFLAARDSCLLIVN
jgi:hypothetical protein